MRSGLTAKRLMRTLRLALQPLEYKELLASFGGHRGSGKYRTQLNLMLMLGIKLGVIKFYHNSFYASSLVEDVEKIIDWEAAVDSNEDIISMKSDDSLLCTTMKEVHDDVLLATMDTEAKKSLIKNAETTGLMKNTMQPETVKNTNPNRKIEDPFITPTQPYYLSATTLQRWYVDMVLEATAGRKENIPFLKLCGAKLLSNKRSRNKKALKIKAKAVRKRSKPAKLIRKQC